MREWIDKEIIECYGKIAGVDEAGRGPLAGPVVAAAVFLTQEQEKDFLLKLPFIDDSKKLNEKKRNEIWKYVRNNRVSHAIGLSDVNKIDQYNILVSTNMAMNSALEKLNVAQDLAIIDGKNLSIKFPNKQIVNGDSLSLRIAIASNIAKVARDQIMRVFSKKYPEFEFEKNKGYGTRSHLQAIKLYGPTPFHRLTFKPLIQLITEEQLNKWLQSGLIHNMRYDIILSKTKNFISKQKQLIGFFE